MSELSGRERLLRVFKQQEVNRIATHWGPRAATGSAK